VPRLATSPSAKADRPGRAMTCAGIPLCDPCPARGLRTTSCPSGPGRRRPGPPGHR
jgi:hypothetical protein